MSRMTTTLTSLAALTAASLMSGKALAQDPIAPRLQTEPTQSAEIQAGVLALDGDVPRILATTSLGGVEVYGLEGARTSSTQSGEVVGIDVAYGFDLGGRAITLVAVTDAQAHALRFYELADGGLMEVGPGAIELDFAGENVCFYHHALDGSLHAFIVGDGGEIDQQLVYAAAGGTVHTRSIRRINVPSPVKQCVADSAGGVVYASEETVGIWRLNADPEADVAAVLIDSPRFGQIEEEVGGLALYDGGEGARWLLASDAQAGRVNVYDRSRDDAYLGSFRIASDDGVMGEPGPLFATSHAVNGDWSNGLLLVTDEDGPNMKAVAMPDLASAMGLSLGTPRDPRSAPERALPVALPTVETTPVGSFGDAADDPVIWAHPTDPGLSLVIATDKQAGLYVYDMAGEVVQFLADGKMNNVDLRDGFNLGGQPVTLVTASNRTDRTIAIYSLDPATRRLTNVAAGPQATGLNDPYGLCMYRNVGSGRTYVFINGDETRKRQWELIDNGDGRVRAELVRDLTFGSQTEGCVADDAAGVLYVGEEDVALWRLPADPDAGDQMTAVDTVADNTAVHDDIEGVSIYDLGDGRGYIIASSQGNDTYAVYRLEGEQEYLGSFAVPADGTRGIDGASETDGLDVSSRNLGPGFEHGALVVQDGRNVMPNQNQNYKYVPWSAIAEALALEMRTNTAR
jgi:3-phytase